MAPIKNDRPLTLSRMKEILDYDPDTGVFTWRELPLRSKIAVGSVAGSIRKPGSRDEYRRIKIDRVSYKASRLAWFYFYGEWPDSYLDHANGVQCDDRLCNLRKATSADNAANKTASGSTGVKGVRKTEWGYGAAIRRHGKYIWLGTYKNIDEAAAARLAAALKIHGDFASEARHG